MKKTLKAFLNLTAFELDRLSKFLYTLIGVTLVANMIGYAWAPMRYISRMNEFMNIQSATSQQAIDHYGLFSFYHAINTIWIVGPIIIGISGFLFYAVFIWYREWFGKNTFAYRLLMLPVPRMTLFFSKLIVIYIGIFSLIATQIISLFIGFQLVSAIIPNDWFAGTTALEAINIHPMFMYILPVDTLYFLTINGIGLVFLIVLFTLILMERSFAVKGIMIGIVYAGTALALAVSPFFFDSMLQNHYLLYPSEVALILIGMMTFITVTSLLVSRHLLSKKITI